MASIDTSILYILSKNEPYCNPVWWVIRSRPDVGVLDVFNYLVNNDSSCCLESGSVKKGSIAAVAAEGRDRVQIVDNFFSCISRMKTSFNGKNSATNICIEKIMSMIRSLSLRCPYRPS